MNRCKAKIKFECNENTYIYETPKCKYYKTDGDYGACNFRSDYGECLNKEATEKAYLTLLESLKPKE